MVFCPDPSGFIENKPVILNLSWPWWQAAVRYQNQRDWIGAGVRCRIAMRFHLLALCAYHGCTPEPTSGKSIKTRALIDAIEAAGLLDKGWGEWLRDCLNVGNRCARGERLDHCRIESMLDIVATFMGELPTGDFERGGNEA